MTGFELVLLELVAKGNGEWSWYEIGKRLPGPYLDQAPEMMQTLNHLVEEGYLLHHTKAGQARDRWELSATGRKMTDNSRSVSNS